MNVREIDEESVKIEVENDHRMVNMDNDKILEKYLDAVESQRKESELRIATSISELKKELREDRKDLEESLSKQMADMHERFQRDMSIMNETFQKDISATGRFPRHFFRCLRGLQYC